MGKLQICSQSGKLFIKQLNKREIVSFWGVFAPIKNGTNKYCEAVAYIRFAHFQATALQYRSFKTLFFRSNLPFFRKGFIWKMNI